MNRALPSWAPARACISRASGDEPIVGAMGNPKFEYFPRERG